MKTATVFAPSPTLTVTVEDHPSGNDVHVHAGGQGVWQARMLRRLGVPVTMCCVLTGELGVVLRHLLADEGLTLAAIERSGRGAAYLHDRRGGERHAIAEDPGDPLSRHDLDELYGLTVREGLASGLAVLSGPVGERVLPADTYRRLAADLRTGGASVIVDLAGDRLLAAVEGGVDIVKVSDEELRATGLLDSDSQPALMAAMQSIRARGADTVVVTRSSDPLLMLDSEGYLEVTPPSIEEVDARGAGDSLTAGIIAGLARGERVRDAITLGAAAGALNVTRHGLGTGDADAIAELRETVTTRILTAEGHADGERLSPDGLAKLAHVDDAEEDE